MASSHITSSSDVAAGDDNIDKTDTKNKGLRDQQASEVIEDTAPDEADFRVYKRRFLGLGQLVLLNIVVSWDWLTFSAVSTTSAEYFDVSEGAINWLSTGFLFAFCVASPFVIWTLNKGGPKPSIIATSVLILIGNWIRYAGVRVPGGNFGATMFGQVLIGLAQPFCLAAPTRYSDLWFSDRGRTSATAVATLANPLGGALGQLIGPIWATEASQVPNMVLYISIISTVAAIPSFFVPARPPTPPSAASFVSRPELVEGAIALSKRLEFWLLFVPFAIYVSLFNSISSLLNQILSPRGFSETEAGITGGILIIVGLISAAITSPIIDRYKFYLPVIKILVPVIAAAYVGFIFAPSASGIGPAYAVAAILGAASFSLLPIALEYLVEITYPFSPETGSTLFWMSGQLFGAIFIVIMNALKDGDHADPPYDMKRALIFQAVMAVAAVPFPLALGMFGHEIRRNRLDAERPGAV